MKEYMHFLLLRVVLDKLEIHMLLLQFSQPRPPALEAYRGTKARLQLSAVVASAHSCSRRSALIICCVSLS